MHQLPANPLSINVKLEHQRLWWQTDDEDHMPERWSVSADVVDAPCPPENRHVADFSLVIADLRRERNLLDAPDLGDWAMEFIAETLIDPAEGRLHPDLDHKITPGIARMVIVRHVAVTPPWQGHGLGGALLAGALRAFAPSARLAVARVSPLDFINSSPDKVSAELASIRFGTLLERIGFEQWREVHFVDLQHPQLLDVRMELFEQYDDNSET
ncbi:hypothetical protein [Haloechinothrix salitolerans]|uniref:N-acetyltransferase domain-containing protein n=1 Tax=Haloechinothrix salitolerans TaxID=926830 RepID=A0ABW2CA11_9PSEU